MQSKVSSTTEVYTAPHGKAKDPSESGAGTASISQSLAEPTDPTNLNPSGGTLAASPAVPPPSSALPPHLTSDSPRGAQPRSRPSSRDTSPYPRSRPATPNRPAPIAGVPPAGPRRSARTLAKGPSRPQGPPELEAALAIAIRNLESDIYEWWCAHQKPGDAVPTTAYLKARSPRIRRAADAVDEADRLLNEAVYRKPKKGRTAAKRSKEPPTPTPSTEGEVPETAFEQLELNSQGVSPVRPTAGETSSMAGDTDMQRRRSTRNKEGLVDL